MTLDARLFRKDGQPFKQSSLIDGGKSMKLNQQLSFCCSLLHCLLPLSCLQAVENIIAVMADA